MFDANILIRQASMALCGAVLTLVLAEAHAKKPEPSGWSQYKGKGYVLCDSLLKELRRYKYPDPLKNPNACSWAVVASYPGFTEPPWENLDVKQHEELLFQLQRFTAIGLKNYFAGIKNKTDQGNTPQSESYSREQVRDFVTGGGQLRLWRTPLFKNYEILDQNPKTKGQLNILQLRTPIGDPKNQGLDQCPDVPKLEWTDYTMLVNEDLTGPDPRLDPKINSWGLKLLNGQTLLFFKGVLHRLDGGGPTIEIYRDDIPSSDWAGDFCRLTYQHFTPGTK